MKILWADDQVDVAKSFSTALDQLGAEIEYVHDGNGAIERLTAEAYDLLLLDLAMPPGRWGGLWVLEKMKQLAINTSVIVVSGEGGQTETIQALRLGAVDYVTKEQLSGELPQQIMNVLANKSGGIDLRQLISIGESDTLEFKSTLRLNLHTAKSDSAMELAVIKSIAAFMNTNGGRVLVGISDDGNVVGIETDKFPSTDKFELHFRNLVRESIGVEFSDLITTGLHSVSGLKVFSVLCRPSLKPVYVSWKNTGESQRKDLFFVRAGPQTESLGTKQAVTYITTHFKGD